MEKDIRKRTFQFAIKVLRYVDSIEKKGIHWSLYDQLLRSGTSIGANVHEAQGGSSRKDFIRFYEIALKSCNETIYWLSLLSEGLAECTDELMKLRKDSIEIGNMLGAAILSLKGIRSTPR